MSRTTESWKTLLDGATPGKWTPEGSMVVAKVDPPYPPTVVSLSTIGNQGRDIHIISAAKESVAEVIRLREELEERLRVWNKVAEKLEAAEYMSNAEVVRHTIHVVERILNPEEES